MKPSVLVMVTGLSLLPVTGYAQENTSTKSNNQFDVVIETCSDEGILTSCPRTCAAACQSIDFLLENTEACEAALVAPPGADGESCPKFEIQLPPTLKECIDERSQIKRNPNILITRKKERLELFNAFFSDRPGCASSSIALTEMFTCLDGETLLVQEEYKALGSLGIPDKPLSSAELRNIACSTDEDRLLEIDIGAGALRARADTLSENLGTVASCRRAYADWFDGRKTFCKTRSFDNCEAVITVFQEDLGRALEGAAEQNEAVESVVGDLSRDINSIMSIALIAGGGSCP